MQRHIGGMRGPVLSTQESEQAVVRGPLLTTREQAGPTQRVVLAPVHDPEDSVERPKLPSLSKMFDYLDRTPPLPQTHLPIGEPVFPVVSRAPQVSQAHSKALGAPFGPSSSGVFVPPTFSTPQKPASGPVFSGTPLSVAQYATQSSPSSYSIPRDAPYRQPIIPQPPHAGHTPQLGQQVAESWRLAGIPSHSSQYSETIMVPSISTGATSPHGRDDLSAEDEQNVAISVYLADSDTTPQLLKNGRYQCPLCPRNYKYAKHVRRHIINHTNIYPHSCTRCNALFRRKDAQRRHMQRIHPDIPPHTYMNSRTIPDSDGKSDESR